MKLFSSLALSPQGREQVAEERNAVSHAERGKSAMTETGSLRGRSAWIHPAIGLADEYVEGEEYRGLDEHAYFDQGGTTPFARA